MAIRNCLTAERLRELLDYDPKTGNFLWKIAIRGGRRKPGEVAGCANGADFGEKYCRIGIDGVRYYAHRLAWLYVYGEWPASNIDHRDGDSDGTQNLRLANQAQNLCNAAKRSDNTSGFKGVTLRKRQREKRSDRWVAVVHVNGKRIHAGCYETARDAALAYDAAARKLYGEFARTNEMLGLL